METQLLQRSSSSFKWLGVGCGWGEPSQRDAEKKQVRKNTRRFHVTGRRDSNVKCVLRGRRHIERKGGWNKKV